VWTTLWLRVVEVVVRLVAVVGPVDSAQELDFL
jgi:hypothetical protein